MTDTETDAMQKICQLIGVDEITKYGRPDGVVLRVRLGKMWLQDVIDISTLEDAKSASAYICDTLWRMAERLRTLTAPERFLESLYLDTAKGADLDKIVESYAGPVRLDGETDGEFRARFFGAPPEDTPQHSNRFEAVVAELLG